MDEVGATGLVHQVTLSNASSPAGHQLGEYSPPTKESQKIAGL
jgi:hypothetical protein